LYKIRKIRRVRMSDGPEDICQRGNRRNIIKPLLRHLKENFSNNHTYDYIVTIINTDTNAISEVFLSWYELITYLDIHQKNEQEMAKQILADHTMTPNWIMKNSMTRVLINMIDRTSDYSNLLKNRSWDKIKDSYEKLISIQEQSVLYKYQETGPKILIKNLALKHTSQLSHPHEEVLGQEIDKLKNGEVIPENGIKVREDPDSDNENLLN